MSGLIADQISIFIQSAGTQSQLTILGLPWWIWLIVLAILAVLIWLLFRQPKLEVKPAIETEKNVAPFIEERGQVDDLTIIEGIGPKINVVLREAGVDTFEKLAATPANRITEILNAAGIHLFDTETWGQQASLAASGKWEELKKLQEKLKGGRLG